MHLKADRMAIEIEKSKAGYESKFKSNQNNLNTFTVAKDKNIPSSIERRNEAVRRRANKGIVKS